MKSIHETAPLIRLLRDDSGVALVFTIAAFLFLFVLILSVYSVGENIRRKEELQNACDAAAYSAAVVQADGLSRMAVINRAMAWTHIQTTKMQMDYITYKWLWRVRNCFLADMDNIKETDMADFGKPEMGYHHLKDQFRDYNGKWLKIHFNCHDGVHDNPLDARARYIGLGPNTEGGYGRAINAANALAGGAAPLLDRHWIRINGFDATKRRLQFSLGDLDYYEGNSCKASRLVSHIENTSGGIGAPKLKKAIQDGKNIVRSCGSMLATVNSAMAKAIPETAKAVLYANLPRKPDGSVDSSLLDDYVFAVVPGAFEWNPYGETQGGNGKAVPIYYDPLYNCEEDEIRFLAMANGLPANSDKVTLKDFFSSTGQGGTLAAGLDQWFIRCDPGEAAADSLSIQRNFAPPSPGIVRCYKNANYKEGRTGSGILRGNYTLDGNGVRKPQTPSDIGSVIGWSLTHCPSPRRNPRWLRAWYAYQWIQEHYRVKDYESSFKKRIKSLWGQVPYSIFTQFSRKTAPSCVNYRNRFVDQCANVSNTWGLYAEYEWAAAYWFCCWIEFKHCSTPGKTMGWTEVLDEVHMPFCVHIPIPSAVFGGRNHVHYGDSDTPNGIAEKQKEPYKEGSRRFQYVRTFIGADGESRYECPVSDGDGDGANMGAKGYVRIYGDDKEIFDECYVGAKAMPWVLNERFFSGMGTIVVGVARKQRNAFYWIVRDGGAAGNGEGIFSAFTPDKKGRPQPRIVALAAARAGYAPRAAGGTGAGADSENAANKGGGKWGRRYELRHDAVTDKRSRGNLYDDVKKLNNGKQPLAYNGSYKSQLENYHIGCVCGNDDTGKRLRREWNLSQTDWDAVLLPLRHAFADPSWLGGVQYDSKMHGKDKLTTWSYSGNGGGSDPQAQFADALPKLTWKPLTGNGAGTTWEKVFLEPNGMDNNGTYKLFKKRLIH